MSNVFTDFDKYFQQAKEAKRKPYYGKVISFECAPFVWTDEEKKEYLLTGNTPRSVSWKLAVRYNPSVKWCAELPSGGLQFFNDFPPCAELFVRIDKRPEWLKTSQRELAEKISEVVVKERWTTTQEELTSIIEKIILESGLK